MRELVQINQLESARISTQINQLEARELGHREDCRYRDDFASSLN